MAWSGGFLGGGLHFATGFVHHSNGHYSPTRVLACGRAAGTPHAPCEPPRGGGRWPVFLWRPPVRATPAVTGETSLPVPPRIRSSLHMCRVQARRAQGAARRGRSTAALPQGCPPRSPRARIRRKVVPGAMRARHVRVPRRASCRGRRRRAVRPSGSRRGAAPPTSGLCSSDRFLRTVRDLESSAHAAPSRFLTRDGRVARRRPLRARRQSPRVESVGAIPYSPANSLLLGAMQSPSCCTTALRLRVGV